MAYRMLEKFDHSSRDVYRDQDGTMVMRQFWDGRIVRKINPDVRRAQYIYDIICFGASDIQIPGD
jgi:hypothetical protein